MRFFLPVLSIALLVVSPADAATSKPKKEICTTKRAPTIKINPIYKGVKITQGAMPPSDGGAFSLSFAADSPNFTYATTIDHTPDITYQSKKTADGKVCMWIDTVSIPIAVSTLASIQDEHPEGTCEYKDAEILITKHAAIDKKLSVNMAQAVGAKLTPALRELPPPGPYDKAGVSQTAAKIKALLNGAVEEGLKNVASYESQHGVLAGKENGKTTCTESDEKLDDRGDDSKAKLMKAKQSAY
jgi:hypothetical protein